MNEGHVQFERTDDGGLVLHFHGAFVYSDVGAVWRNIMNVLKNEAVHHLVLDLHQVERFDTSGVALLQNIKDHCSENGIPVTEEEAPQVVEKFLTYIRKHSRQEEKIFFMPSGNLIERLGKRLEFHLVEAKQFVEFLGRFIAGMFMGALQPRRWRFKEIFYQTQAVGGGAVLLLTALSLLLGALMVFQGMKTMRSFGAKIHIADLVLISVTREMGPLLTAVVLSGRTGAAFAAELGSMKINQEIDALNVMDLDVNHFLVFPRVLAVMIAAPLLTMISDAAGVLGGLITSNVAMGLPFDSFLREVHKMFEVSDIYTGLIKAVTFGAFIGLVGCFKGLRTEMGAISVGQQTTSSVVTCIFLVILLDTLFSYIFQLYGW